MTELEMMERARQYMEKLANGIHPLDGSEIPEENVANNVRLSRCFFYVADVLRRVIENGGISPQPKLKKRPFDLPVEKREAFAFSAKPITMSELVKRVNELVDGENMVKLTHPMVTQWLVSIGLLQTVLNADGKNTKRPTPQGESVGIALETRSGLNGPYFVVTYDLAAQHFVLDNLDAVIQIQTEKKENQGQPWNQEQEQCLLELYRDNVPIKEIAAKLKRSSGAIRSRLEKLGIQL